MKEEVEDVDRPLQRAGREHAELLHEVRLGPERGERQQESGGDEEDPGERFEKGAHGSIVREIPSGRRGARYSKYPTTSTITCVVPAETFAMPSFPFAPSIMIALLARTAPCRKLITDVPGGVASPPGKSVR